MNFLLFSVSTALSFKSRLNTKLAFYSACCFNNRVEMTMVHFCWATFLPSWPHNFTHYRWTSPLTGDQNSSVCWFGVVFFFCFGLVSKEARNTAISTFVLHLCLKESLVIQLFKLLFKVLLSHMPTQASYTHSSLHAEPTGRNPQGSRLKNKSAIKSKTQCWTQIPYFLLKIKSL